MIVFSSLASVADIKIQSHLSHPILDRSAAQADAVAAVAATAAANNKFIAADEVHKLIITSRQRISPPRVPVQTITDDLQHNGARLTDAELTRATIRAYTRLDAFAASATCVRLPACGRKRYSLDSEGAQGFSRARVPKTQRRCRLRKSMPRATYNSIRNDPRDAQ